MLNGIYIHRPVTGTAETLFKELFTTKGTSKLRDLLIAPFFSLRVHLG